MRFSARPVLSGPKLNRNVAWALCFFRISMSGGTPSRVPRRVSTSIVSASKRFAMQLVVGAVVGDVVAQHLGQVGAELVLRPITVHHHHFGDLHVVTGGRTIEVG